MNLPTRLSLARIFLAFFFLIFSHLALRSEGNIKTMVAGDPAPITPVEHAFIFNIITLLLFAAASITDYYDGKLARERNQVTDFGKFIDPLADKIMVSAAFISFLGYRKFDIPSWAVVIIISREFIITGLRNMLYSKGVTMAADLPGKFKTTFQIIVIIAVLLINTFSWLLMKQPGLWKYMEKIPTLLIYTAVLVTVYSAVNYFYKYKKIINEAIM